MKKMKALFVAAMLISTTTFAQEERPVHEVYSMMLWNFIKYIQWPDQSGSGEFVIGVVGNTNMYNSLTTMYAGKPRGSKTYVIKKFNSAADVTADCAVLFLDKSKSGEFEAINNKVNGKNTLVVTDKHGLAARGSAINFTTVDNKLKFELNQKVVEASNLKVSGTLTSLAILI